ncbi:ParB/RepB/Spo0J family partition protein [Henriciella sp.]|jgi:ParB family chromosome partitioning protein|uniref:ParB/RepB/Spo0J family partition protein n=1 Tax=Henriciella sp. TaxID=1968823 RepID=UPI000C5C218D|nr:ParB/RepB/Spo0J family partition protein [Henriciella sp.]MAN74220.1 partitioning protein [Henriciella sp.]|tara:strand:+ start:1113 stop:3137 length:2025 start_codon:yes stop_codon:yes gene_type:complete
MSSARVLTDLLGPRPRLTLVIAGARIVEIWVEGRAPLITIRDYDEGETDPDAARDGDGFAYTKINWRDPAWALGLSFYPPEKETSMAQPDLRHIPLDELRMSKLNMRHGRRKPDVSDILPSIREKGVRQTLLVRREGKYYGVIAGRRRFFALKEIAKETGETPLVPCAVMTEKDAASAIAASVIENVGRLPATEMEQYEAFRRLHEEGRAVGDIAAFFGVTELLVRRVLALASLSAPIRKLYAEDELDRETIRALTLATEDQQAAWLRLWESETERAPIGWSCKAWITGGTTITTDKALFDLDAYDGQVTADLFGDHGVFADADAFWQAQSAAIAARIEAYLAEGWSDVVCLERGAYFQRWDHVACDRENGGKVYIEIRHDGTTLFHEGHISSAEARRRERAAKGEAGSAPAAVRPEMSGPLAEYILLHRHAAAQASLAGSPAIALRLMVAHAMCGSALWDVRPHEVRTRRAETQASVEDSKSVAELAEAKTGMEALFRALNTSPAMRRNGDDYRLCEVFSALLAMSDDEVLSVLAAVMAETLEAGNGVSEALLHVCGTDLAARWKPDAAFFELVRDKRAINAMVADIGTQSLADSCRTETGKAQKQVLRNRIAGEGCEASPDWRPGWMQLPPVRLVDGAGSPPAEAWERVAGLFETRAADTKTDATVSQSDAA